MYKNLKKASDRILLIISHDLRSPFSGLLGLSGMLSEEFEKLPPEELKEYLVTINETLIKTYEMIDTLAEWGRIERERYEKVLEEIPLKYGLNDIINEIEKDIKNKDIKVVHSYNSDVIIYANNNMLSFVLKNFLSNAVKFSKRGSRVYVDYSEDSEKSIVSVRDEGIGIDQQRVGNLFSINSKWRINGTEGENGTGLGLIASSRFAKYFGATIEVDSAPGAGSTFSLILPKRPA